MSASSRDTALLDNPVAGFPHATQAACRSILDMRDAVSVERLDLLEAEGTMRDASADVDVARGRLQASIARLERLEATFLPVVRCSPIVEGESDASVRARMEALLDKSQAERPGLADDLVWIAGDVLREFVERVRAWRGRRGGTPG